MSDEPFDDAPVAGNLIDFGASKRRREAKAAEDAERVGFLQEHRKPDRAYCGHHDQGVYVDREAREVSCQKCGAELDPVEVLAWFARICDDVTWSRRESKRIREESAKMDKRLKTVKAAIRREVEKARAAGLVEGAQATRSKRTQWMRTSENDRLAERIEAHEDGRQP